MIKKGDTISVTFAEAYRSGHNEAVLKTVWVQAHGGSNPSASAIKIPGPIAEKYGSGIFYLTDKTVKIIVQLHQKAWS